MSFHKHQNGDSLKSKITLAVAHFFASKIFIQTDIAMRLLFVIQFLTCAVILAIFRRANEMFSCLYLAVLIVVFFIREPFSPADQNLFRDDLMEIF